MKKFFQISLIMILLSGLFQIRIFAEGETYITLDQGCHILMDKNAGGYYQHTYVSDDVRVTIIQSGSNYYLSFVSDDLIEPIGIV